MGQKHHRVDRIITNLRRTDVELGNCKKVPDIYKLFGTAEPTYYCGCQKNDGIQPEMAKELKNLQKENDRLKKMMVKKVLDMEFLKEAAKGNY